MASITDFSYSRWAIDVAALMVLIGENEELQYRLTERSLLEAVVAAPVAGIQGYLRSYDLLLEQSSFMYFTPRGCKRAPLRNMKLDNAIRQIGLIKTGRFTVLKIPSNSSASPTRWYWLWVLFTWMGLIGLMAFLCLYQRTSWIGATNCLVLTVWSILLRTVEWHAVRPSFAHHYQISKPDDPDSIFILGSSCSAIILEGSRKDVKEWTNRPLAYGQGPDGQRSKTASALQGLSRVGTLLVLLLVFSTMSNGTTVDQIAFGIWNALGQINSLLGRWFNGRTVVENFQKNATFNQNVPSQTHLYANLIRHFERIPDQSWIEKADLLPHTEIWEQWKLAVCKDKTADPKALYHRILEDVEKSHPVDQQPLDHNKPTSLP